jgi:hypothetical protein
LSIVQRFPAVHATSSQGNKAGHKWPSMPSTSVSARSRADMLALLGADFGTLVRRRLTSRNAVWLHPRAKGAESFPSVRHSAA